MHSVVFTPLSLCPFVVEASVGLVTSGLGVVDGVVTSGNETVVEGIVAQCRFY